MTDMSRCRCCCITIDPAWGAVRQRLRVCPICDLCDERHGHALHMELCRRVHAGTIDPYLVIAVSAFDDAWITGYGEIGANGLMHVNNQPKRWEVVFAWCRLAKTTPTLESIMHAVLAPHLGRPNAQHVRDEISRDMRDALCVFDPNLIDVEIEASPNALISDEINIRAIAKAPIFGAITIVDDLSAEIPTDIMSRPRGSA